MIGALRRYNSYLDTGVYCHVLLYFYTFIQLPAISSKVVAEKLLLQIRQ